MVLEIPVWLGPDARIGGLTPRPSRIGKGRLMSARGSGAPGGKVSLPAV
jgi:hypothetical protein